MTDKERKRTSSYVNISKVSMASLSTGSVSHSGILRNTLAEHFTTRDCVNELIDDSLGAKATRIRIGLDTSGPKPVFWISDNGVGMTQEELQRAHILHNRGTPTNEKHGRFGIGRKHALTQFTQLKGTILTLTRPKENMSKRFELEIDFVDVIKKDLYDVRANKLAADNMGLWDKYAMDPTSHGTITIIEIDDDIVRELEEMMESPFLDKNKNLSYTLGETYSEWLEQGATIEIVHNENHIRIQPHDFLQWDEIDEENKSEMVFHVYELKGKEGVVRLYYHTT